MSKQIRRIKTDLPIIHDERHTPPIKIGATFDWVTRTLIVPPAESSVMTVAPIGGLPQAQPNAVQDPSESVALVGEQESGS